MAEYLFAVQDRGREVVSWRGDVAKVSNVRATYAQGTVAISNAGELMEFGPWEGDLADLRLYRWPADDKLATPVARRVQEVS